MTTYDWIITQINVNPVENDLTDVVKVIHWRYRASDDVNSTEIFGTVDLSSVNPTDFVQYSDLTKEIVVSWLEASLDVENLKDSLQKTLDELKAKPVAKELPWN